MHRHSSTFNVIVIVFLCIINIISAPTPSRCQEAASDPCAAVLKDGVFNTMKSTERSNFDKTFIDAMLRVNISEAERHYGHDGQVGIEFLNIKGSFRVDELKKMQELYRTQHYEQIRSEDEKYVYTHIASENILKAWIECRKIHEDNAVKQVFTLKIEPHEDQFIVILNWQPYGPLITQLPVVTIEDFIVAGPCKPVTNAIHPGLKFSGEKRQIFKRTGKGSIQVVVNLAQYAGSASNSIPGIPPPPPSKRFPPITRGLVSFWPGDGHNRDVMSRNDGVMLGATDSGETGYDAGVRYQAFSSLKGFNGLKVFPNSTLDIDKAVTISAWIKPLSDDQGNAHTGGILAKGNDQTRNYFLAIYGHSISLAYLGQNGHIIALFTKEIPKANEWSHIAGVIDTERHIFKVYVNGIDIHGDLGVDSIAKGQETTWEHMVEPLSKNNLPLTIGYFMSADKDVEHFQGLIDEVAVYRVALNPAEIKALAKVPTVH